MAKITYVSIIGLGLRCLHSFVLIGSAVERDTFCLIIKMMHNEWVGVSNQQQLYLQGKL